MGERKKGNADYEKGYRKGYKNGYQAGKKSKVRKEIRDFSNLEEVVRCIRCANNRINVDGVSELWCYQFGYEVEADGYCNYGEAVE